MLQLKKKISRRFFFALISIAMLPICIISYYFYRASRTALTKTAYLHMATIARDHANHLDTWFQERLNDINIIARLPMVREYCSHHCSPKSLQHPVDGDQKQLNSLVSLTQGRSPSYESVHILSPTGIALASTDPLSEDVRNFDRLEIVDRVRLSGKAALSSVHQHKDGRWRMHLVAPILDGSGKPIAYVLAVLNASKTIDPIMTDRVGLGKTGETYLVDKSGRIVSQARYINREKAARTLFQSYGIREALAGREGSAVYDNYAGHKVIGSYLWLPRFQWGLLAEMQKNEIMAPLQGIGMTVLGAIVVVTILSFLLALLVSYRVARPISRMADAAQDIARGRLDQRIQYEGEDEVGVLAKSFNTMIQNLSSLIASLHHKEKSLQEAYNQLILTQEQLVKSERMAAIGELVASVVHEMRGPLSSIKLNLQIIGRSVGAETPLAEHFEIALGQVAQLEKMFSDLLNYSKPLKLEKTSTNIADVIETSLMQLKEELLKQEITIRKEFHRTLPTIMVDPEKIQQVFVNVLKNALEACGPKGTIEIAAALDQDNEYHRLIVSFSDDGPGIPEQHLHKVFQPFFTTKKKGTGLGLAIVRKIMDAHDAEIYFEIVDGLGTTARLSFPAAGKACYEKDPNRR